MEKMRSGCVATSRWLRVLFPVPEGAESTNTLPWRTGDTGTPKIHATGRPEPFVEAFTGPPPGSFGSGRHAHGQHGAEGLAVGPGQVELQQQEDRGHGE